MAYAAVMTKDGSSILLGDVRQWQQDVPELGDLQGTGHWLVGFEVDLRGDCIPPLPTEPGGQTYTNRLVLVDVDTLRSITPLTLVDGQLQIDRA